MASEVTRLLRKHGVTFLTVISVIMLLLPPIALLFFIRAFAVNAVYWDDWAMVPFLQKLQNGTLSLSDLFAQYNEHRILFPRMLVLGLAQLNRFNSLTDAFFNWGILCSTAFIIFYSYYKPPRLSKKSVRETEKAIRLLTFIPASFLLFDFGQYEAILWGPSNVLFYLGTFAAIAALTALDRSRKLGGWFAVGILSAVLATYSSATGLFVWVAGVLLISLAEGEAFRRKLAVWVILGVVAWAVYLNGWMHPTGHPSLYFTFQDPIFAGAYFLALLGTPITGSPCPSCTFAGIPAVAAGLMLVLIGAGVITATLKSSRAKRSALWLSLVAFVVLSSAATTVGRAGFGVWQALSSRYTILTSIGIVGVYLLGEKLSSEAVNRKRGYFYHAILTLILVGLISSYGAGLQAGASWHNNQQITAYVTITYRYQSDRNIVAYAYPGPVLFRDWAKYLEQNKLNVFAQTQNLTYMPGDSSQARFAVDTVMTDGSAGTQSYKPSYNQSVTVGSGEDTFTVTGWAFDGAFNRTASAVFVVINGNTSIPVLYGIARPDVAEVYKNPNLADSGWFASFSTSVFATGPSVITLNIVSSDGIHYYSTQPILLVVAA